jgi:transposase
VTTSKPIDAMRASCRFSIAPGCLTVIRIPIEQEEAGLLRCREEIRADLLRARHRLSKFLLRHGRRFTEMKNTWTKRHSGLQAKHWPLAALEQTHRAYIRAVEEAVARLQAVDTELRDLLTFEPLRARVERVWCFRGIDDLTALTIAAELGDPRRFPTAPQLMAFTSLVPSEYSSGAKQARGSHYQNRQCAPAARAGRSRVAFQHHPFLGGAPRLRQRGAPAAVIQQAWHAQHRLRRRHRCLAARGNPSNYIVTAVTRELTGFVWAALTQ